MGERILDLQNLPTPKVEEWKYTNLSRALGDLKDTSPEDAQEIVIHKNSGEVCEQIEEIVWTGEAGKHQRPHLKIVLEEGAQMTLVERHTGDGPYWKNMSTEIVLSQNARLNHIRFQEDSPEAIQTNLVHVQMERDSYLNSFSLNLGGKMTRHDIHAVLNGENIDCSFNGVNLLDSDQHGDTTILMEHAAPHCLSNQFYRTILDDAARGVFQGKVHVHQIAQKTDGYQLANTILLSEKAEMDTKPELEIYADDVKCSHGATTGALDEEPLFYLRSRGLTDGEARMLLMQAFVDEVADKIEDDKLQDEVKEKMEWWLKDALK